MLRREQWQRMPVILLFCLLLTAMSVFAGSAAEGDIVDGGEQEVIVETDAPVETEPAIETEPAAEEDPAPAEEPAYVEPAEPTYEQPEHLDELPTVQEYEIELATAVELPDIEVSDTSLLGGVIAWLCVAVGIAVIAGVLVSKRTRRKTADR